MNCARAFQPTPALLPLALALALSGPGFAQDSPPEGSKAGASDDAVALDTVEVRGVRQSLISAQAIKQATRQVVDAIVAEDIGKFPDNNVVEALQRVTGVQTTGRGGGEVAGVTIRGLGDASTTINGRQMFTSTGRSVALADIPASLLSEVTVYKTRSADLVEGGIAGQIDIRTHRPLDFEGSKVSVAARGIHASNTGKFDPNLSALFSDRWSTSAGEFGALLNLSYARTNYRDENIWNGSADPYYADTYQRVPEFGANGQRIVDRGTPLPTTPGSTLDVNGVQREYVLLRDALGGWNRFGERKRPAANLAFQFQPNDWSEYTFEAFYNGYRNTDSNSLLFAFANNPDRYQDSVLYPGSNVVKQNYINNPYIFTSTQARDAKTDTFQYALGGKWEFTDNFKLKSEAVYQTSQYDWHNQILDMGSVRHRMAVDFNNAGSGTPSLSFPDNPATADIDESDLTDPRGWGLAWYYDQHGRDKGDALTWQTDSEYRFDTGFFESLKFGVRLDRRSATSQAGDRSADCGAVANCSSQRDVALHPDLYRASPGSFYSGEANFPRRWIIADHQYLLSHSDEMRAMYGFSSGRPLYDPARFFDIEEDTYAAYLQTDFSTELPVGVLDGQVGVRAVRARTEMNYNSLVQDWVPTSIAKSRTDVLPSAVLRWHATEKLMARLAYGQTISRPAFAQLNPAMVLTPPSSTAATFGYATSGNPNLAPVEAKTIDLALEYYFSASNSIYAVAFLRDVDGFIFNADRSITVDDRSPALNGNYVLTSPQNAGAGTLKGLELGFQYFPENVPDWLRGIGIQGNYTWIDGESKDPVYDEADSTHLLGYKTNPLIGVSDWSYSVVLMYERGRFSSRLSWVDRDKFLTSYNYCCSMPTQVWSAGEGSMDLQFSWQATPSLVLTLDATNLTGEKYQDYYGNRQLFNLGTNMFSRTYAVGLRYQF
ncbi:TonB-dependent receptor [Stenotrophomonas maltophilia]|uniref:TonB-dependent receptor n=1 Tax=Stenotrophomonas maltophilia TaxID=40324 RepID=A0A246ID86_STEMA|nr:TonB-dependent receptor [Stenotrophomonas maltophilia]OWQ77996.1 TonB-dependent receptor [Stenotrophomonas maltophilia]